MLKLLAQRHSQNKNQKKSFFLLYISHTFGKLRSSFDSLGQLLIKDLVEKLHANE